MALRLVQLLINTSTGYGRALISGVSRYARRSGHWTTVVPISGVGAPVSDIGPHAQGVIARVDDQAVLATLRRTRVPIVNVSDAIDPLPPMSVIADHAAIGTLAAEHLLEQGFEHFGFCGFASFAYSRDRGDAFGRALASRSTSYSVYPDPGGRRRNLSVEMQRLARWLGALPRPLAVFACNDIRGQHVVEACFRAGIAVPDEVAVLGVDNDPITCEASHVPLSSIDPAADAIGYRAAELLDRLMESQQVDKQPVLMRPAGVVTRRSTDVLVVPDPLVRQALQIMRRPGSPPQSIAEILDELATSRRPLEVRFARTLGRSPYQELSRVRLRHAQQLLRETDLSIKQVAQRCGYKLGTRLAVAFRRSMRMSPSQYREQYHRQASATAVG